MVVRWLTKLWSRDDAPPSPVLLRVVEADGEAPVVLDVEMAWAPSGRRVERSVRTADGLCVLHWRGVEERVDILIRSATGQSQLAVERRGNDGRVFELQLAPARPLSQPSPRLVTSSSSV